MKMPVWSAAALALASVLCVPSLAMAQPTITLPETASLDAQNWHASLSIPITCPVATNTVYVGVYLLQEVGSENTTAYGAIGGINSNITCNPTLQTVEVVVTASGRPFQQGQVIAYGTMYECAGPGLTGCDSAFETGPVQLNQAPSSSVRRR